MDSERNRLERIVAVLGLGLVEALKDDLISIDEAEKLLFTPGMMGFCEAIGACPEVIHLLHIGTELEDVVRVLPKPRVPAAFQESLESIRAEAHAVLANTDQIDGYLDPWLPRVLKRGDA